MTSSGIPYVELYRPKHFEDIVLDPLNKQILKNIIETSYFPNLLFYGPPGTGKTTTIINLINAYQEKLDKKHENKNITEKYIKKLKNRRLFEPSFRELYIKCRMSKLMISIKYTEINTNHLVICTAPHQEMP